jgi:thiosulfate/3-mercaptopyruvate sulfurtransferase
MAVKDKGYARPELLVDTDWLQDRLLEPRVQVVDCGFWASYTRAHIPGAVGVRRDHYFKDETTGSTFIDTPEQFAAEMAGLGIGNETQVVAYDDFGGLWAARLWWALNYYGHENVAVLDGGWRKWLREKRPITDTRPQRAEAAFTPRPNTSILATAEQIMTECISDSSTDGQTESGQVLLDVRSTGEYTGENDRGNARAGHMPGATNVEWLNFVTDDDIREFRPASELREILGAAGVTPDKKVTTY